MRRIALGIAAAAGLTVAGAAQADIVSFDFLMDGLQEVPVSASPGFGMAHIDLDTVTGGITVTGSYSGLVANANNAHVHGLAAPGANASPILNLTFTPSTSGTISGAGTLTPAQVTGMLNGLTYVNLHSTAFPGGEIRGQVVPAPASLGLIGLGGLLASRRRR